jgi:predicted phage tail protein
MTNVYLYGELQNKFGSEFRFSIGSAKEALLAINANRKGFLDEIKKLGSRGIFYRVVVDDQVIQDPKELEITKVPQEVHIVPIVWGAGKNGALIAVGAILMIATAGAAGLLGAAMQGAIIGSGGMAAGSLFASAVGAAGGGLSMFGSVLFGIGASLALQGVMGLLYPPPKPDFNQEVAAGGKSYLFGGRSNNTSQGQAVPVGYGRLLIGSSQISSNLGHYPLKTDIKALMTPVDRPIDDYTDLEFSNEDETAAVDSFYTNQAMGMDESLSFTSVNILNSYSSIISRSVVKVTTEPVEVVVKRNAEIISNPNLPNYDSQVQYLWEDISSDTNKGKVKIENPYAFNSGVVYRSYFAKDFAYYSNLVGAPNTSGSYFISYPQNTLVRYGPAQFRTLEFAVWDTGYYYASGELAKLTGTTGDLHYKSLTGHSGISPIDATSGSTCWKPVASPASESLYKSLFDVTGWLPTDTNAWSQITSPTTSGQFHELINLFGSPYSPDAVHGNAIKDVNINTVISLEGSSPNVGLNADNYAMEFLGFYKVPFVRNRVINIADAENGVMYEVINPGATGVQWTGAGLTGQGGSAIPVVAGMTFTKNANQVTGDGTVVRVASYKFKLDSDDASDLYIDGQLASSYYGNHGMYSGFADYQNPTEGEIEALTSTTLAIPLTIGYHRIYARFQDSLGGEGISIYRKLDTNGDGVYSDWSIAPKDELYHRKISDFSVNRANKFSTKNELIPASSTVVGKKYRIAIVGSINWGSIGASSPRIGTVFVRRAGSVTGSDGFVFEDTFSHYESTAANSNRIVVFSSERPKKNEKIDTGLSYYQAKYKCKVIVDNEEKNTAPVKLNIRFLPTEVQLDSTQRGDLSIPAFTDV